MERITPSLVWMLVMMAFALPYAFTDEPIRVARLPPVGDTGPSLNEPVPPDPAPAVWTRIAAEEPIIWWDRVATAPLRDTPQPVPLDVPTLFWAVLQSSNRVMAIQELPRIRAEDIVRADAEFDLQAFVKSKFIDTNDPVTNTLTTGGPPRLNEHNWNYEMGVAKKTRQGGSLEVAQQLGHRNSNSLFFVPNNQGSARLRVSFIQPLLKGHGKEYNSGLIVVAELQTEMAQAQFVRELQDTLYDLASTYWTLYVERCELLQRRRHLERANELAEELKARQAYDALPSQVVRVQAAVARREADLRRSDASIRNTESKLRSIASSPLLGRVDGMELVPIQPPTVVAPVINIGEEVRKAIQSRPEINEAMQQARVASVRLGMANNELLPALNMVIESYVSGVEGESAVGTAITDQFSRGSPSYTAGLVFEVPLYQRAARAQYRQRQAELSRAAHALEVTMTNIVAEVEIAARNVEAAYAQVEGQYRSLEATHREVEYLKARWQTLIDDDRTASLLIEDLLNAHERLLSEERSLVQAMAAYNVSAIELQRSTATLIHHGGPLFLGPVKTGGPVTTGN